MANLTAVLRKTIDGLPNATPQLRAKVYEKARAAIARQISAANPPLEPHVVETRYRVLEDAIRDTEAHYAPAANDAADAASDVAQTPVAPPPPEPVAPARDVPPPLPAPVRPPAAPFSRANPRAAPADAEGAEARPAPRPQSVAAEPPRPVASEPAAPPYPEASPEAVPTPLSERGAGRAPDPHPALLAGSPGDAEPVATPPVRDAARTERRAPQGPAPAETARARLREADEPPLSADEERFAARVPLRPAADPQSGERPAPVPGTFVPGIPEADLAGPRVARRRAPARSGRGGLPIGAILGGLAIVGLGTAGYLYREDIRSVLIGPEQVAGVPTATTDGAEAPADPAPGVTPETAVPPAGTAQDTAPGAGAPAPTRQFTQRLQPDGTEIDEGPGTDAANAFEEGTDVSAASPVAPASDPPAAAVAPAVPAATPTDAPATATAAVPVGQRAVFYEERSAERDGSQLAGNVVWSVVNEPPADGQPPEPAIRGVADVPDMQLRLTMTIRRNADATLPASHVVELMFDTPSGFVGGAIENVQRLALKPTEQARGEPLIGVAGKISDGFFIIALNDLPQAIAGNTRLLRDEEWIDVPMAYATGQRALISMEKGIVGDRVFAEALDAWASRT